MIFHSDNILLLGSYSGRKTSLISLFVLIAIIGTLTMISFCGRVFCGWLCPHNVFLEMVFRPIEQWWEGRGHKRAINAKKDLDGGRLIRKLAKWLFFMLAAGVLANTATAIFVGTEAFIAGLFIHPVEHPEAATFFAIFFAAILFNFTWFREQTCTIVCPYGRLQAAMLDANTLAVSYDYNRGEPRGKRAWQEKVNQTDQHQKNKVTVSIVSAVSKCVRQVLISETVTNSSASTARRVSMPAITS